MRSSKCNLRGDCPITTDRKVLQNSFECSERKSANLRSMHVHTHDLIIPTPQSQNGKKVFRPHSSHFQFAQLIKSATFFVCECVCFAGNDIFSHICRTVTLHTFVETKSKSYLLRWAEWIRVVDDADPFITHEHDVQKLQLYVPSQSDGGGMLRFAKCHVSNKVVESRGYGVCVVREKVNAKDRFEWDWLSSTLNTYWLLTFSFSSFFLRF